MIKLDSLAVLAKPAMSAKIRVKINCHSPSIEKKGENQFQLLHMGTCQVWPKDVTLYYHNNRQICRQCPVIIILLN